MLRSVVLSGVVVFTAASLPSAGAQSDLQITEQMQHRASLVCADYSVARGNPGIAHVSVDALCILLEHRYTLCPDRRVQGDAALIWYPQWGSLVWNPERAESLTQLNVKSRELAKTLDFPQQLTVWNGKGEELRGQVVPEFHSRCMSEVFAKCF